MLKLGCTLPNPANMCLLKPINHKIYSSFEGDKEICERNTEDVAGGLSKVFTRKAVGNQTYIRNSPNVCKIIAGIDGSQIYPFLMCQEMLTGLYTRWQFDSETDWFEARNNRTRNILVSRIETRM